MLKEQVYSISQAFEAAAQVLISSANLTPAPSFQVVLDRPRQAEHGDLACNLAMQIAKPLRMAPRVVAEKLSEQLQTQAGFQALVQSVEIAGPGFINIRLRPAARQAVVQRVLETTDQFGQSQYAAGQRVLVEFVSANPTGPLHVGHARQAALGDVLSSVLSAVGYQVSREFYYNDAGAQINNLALSVRARLLGITGDDPRFPADGYRGLYIDDIANDFRAGKTVGSADVAPVTANGDCNDLEAIRKFAVAYLRNEQDLDLKAFGVKFDCYYLESSLYTDGRVDSAVDRLNAHGKTYEQDGALWFKATEYGDDKDRVMRKAEGGYTYFVPDIAYHVSKWERGFERVINIQGSDHHGTIARVRAGLQGVDLGIPADYPDYLLHKMVRVTKGGEEIKMSKRAGTGVSLRDLIDLAGGEDPALSAEQKLERGRDAVRFFLASRKADSEYTFDVDLAVSRTDENPVFYIQYAHARICSVLNQWVQSGGALADLAHADLSSLTHDAANRLMARLAEFPTVLIAISDDLGPHALAYYLKDVAADFHTYYNAERVLVDDEAIKKARLALWAATKQVLVNGLRLMGLTAPEKM